MSYAKDLWKFLDTCKFPVGDPKRFIVESTKFHLVNGARFVVPEDGMLMDDPQRRGLDTESPLHLPFDSVILQFKVRPQEIDLDKPDFGTATKAVIVVRKDLRGAIPKSMPNSESWVARFDPVFVTGWIYAPAKHRWMATSAFLMPTKDWYGGRYPDGSIKHRIFTTTKPGLKELSIVEIQDALADGEAVTPYGLEPIIELLNLLACSNVKTNKVRTDKPKGDKPPIPFSETWEITIDSTKEKTKPKGEIAGCQIIDRRSPREHVRRGHIRKYEDGKRTWVNSAVISKGTIGKITKSYKVKK